MIEEVGFDDQDEPRPHHHFFAHRLLRNLVAHDPRRFFDFMQQDDRRVSVIDRLWRHCDEVLDEEFGRRTFDSAETTSRASHIGPFPAIFVRLPPAKRTAEAIWVLAVLTVPTDAFTPPMEQPGYGYFTAEWSHDGIAVCEWTAVGVHHNYVFVDSEEGAMTLIEDMLHVGDPQGP